MSSTLLVSDARAVASVAERVVPAGIVKSRNSGTFTGGGGGGLGSLCSTVGADSAACETGADELLTDGLAGFGLVPAVGGLVGSSRFCSCWRSGFRCSRGHRLGCRWRCRLRRRRRLRAGPRLGDGGHRFERRDLRFQNFRTRAIPVLDNDPVWFYFHQPARHTRAIALRNRDISAEGIRFSSCAARQTDGRCQKNRQVSHDSSSWDDTSRASDMPCESAHSAHRAMLFDAERTITYFVASCN